MNTTPPDQDSQGSKERKVSALVMWYLPVIDHSKRMFSNAREAQLLLWHVQWKRVGKIRHPADGRQWKHFDLIHEEDFSNDPRHHMVVMMGYVCNRAHPEGSMIEGYTTEEVIKCYTDYIKDGKLIGVSVSWHHGALSGKGTKGAKSIIDATYETVHEAVLDASVSSYV
jgi:hypothetical protein